MVIRQALGDQRNFPISEVKQGIFQVRGAEPNSYVYSVILHDL